MGLWQRSAGRKGSKTKRSAAKISIILQSCWRLILIICLSANLLIRERVRTKKTLTVQDSRPGWAASNYNIIHYCSGWSLQRSGPRRENLDLRPPLHPKKSGTTRCLLTRGRTHASQTKQDILTWNWKLRVSQRDQYPTGYDNSCELILAEKGKSPQ